MALLCPKCSRELHEIESEGICIDFCSECKGIWFDRDELLYFLKAHVGEPSLTLAKKDSNRTDVRCPRCKILFEEANFAAQSGSSIAVGNDLRIDHCPKCHGIWLDENEFEKTKKVAGSIENNDSDFLKSFQRIEPNQLYIFQRIETHQFLKKLFIPVLIIALVSGVLIGRGCRDKKSEDPPVLRPNICGSCLGKGKISSICAQCRGSGRIYLSSASAKTDRCPICNGIGKLKSGVGVNCAKCGGTGWIEGFVKNCSRCNGMGNIETIVRRDVCGACRGTGQIMTGQRCTACKGTGRSSVNPQWGCPGCSGTGSMQVKKTCSNCLGGTIDIKGWKSCPDCKGIGRISTERKVCDECLGEKTSSLNRETSCRHCSGTGFVMRSDSNRQICPGCIGTGKLERHCPSCNGKGEILND